MSVFAVGVEVYVRGTGWNNSIHTNTIERETKTMWVLDNGKKYYKESLREYGNRWSGDLKLLTDEVRHEIKLMNKKRSVSNLMYDLGQKRNHIKTKEFKDLRKAEIMLKDVFELIGIDRSK